MAGITLHIGFSKTGTTTLQRAVFENHSQIYYLGKIYQSQHPRQCITADTFDFLEPLLWKTGQPCDLDAEKKFFVESLTSRVDANKIILGSWEDLGQQGVAIRAGIDPLMSFEIFCETPQSSMRTVHDIDEPAKSHHPPAVHVSTAFERQSKAIGQDVYHL